MGASFQKIEVIANVASGSVGPGAPDQVAAILAEFGMRANVRLLDPARLVPCLQEAVAAAPDLLIVLAGDGTARAVAELCGPAGPVIVPLPGGTMNMLPHAVYGLRPWPAALRLVLEHGFERPIGGGEVGGRSFLVAAILGPPALWAPAREAVRMGLRRRAWARARYAMRRAFSGRLRYNLDDGQREKAEALIFMCPLTSRALSNDAETLEAAALDVRDVAAALRLGFHALTGDWRDAPGVEVQPCAVARIWSPNGIPALLDGEPVHLETLSEVRYIPEVARILALPKDLM